MREKRLGVVATAQPGHGGQFQYTLAMIRALRELPGWRVTIYRKPSSTAYGVFGVDERDLRFGRLHSLILGLMSAVGIPMVDSFRNEDVVIAPMYAPQLLHTRRPFCYTLHDLQEYYFPEYFSRHQKIWRRFLHRRLTKSARRVICESQFVRADMIKHLQVAQEKIEILPAPPLWEDERESRVDLSAVSRRYGLPGSFLFFPAQFWAHKNHLRLLDAFASLERDFPDLHLVFTGHRKFEYEAVMRKVEELGLKDRILHPGYVAAEDMPAFYKLALALVMPSLFESISIPVYEAFRAGTPVCASNAFGLADQIGSAGLTFDSHSVEDMAQAMRRIAGDANLRRELVAKGREALATLTVQRYAGQLQKLLIEMSGD